MQTIKDTELEILIRLPYDKILSNCQLSKKINSYCKSDELWIRKAGYDLNIDWKGMDFKEIFDLPRVNRIGKPIEISPFNRYIRTLLYFNKITPETLKIISTDYIAALAIKQDNLELLKGVIKNVLAPSVMLRIAMILKRYNILEYFTNNGIYDMSTLLELYYIGFDIERLKISGLDKKSLHFDIAIIEGKNHDITHIGEKFQIVKYTYKSRGLNAALDLRLQISELNFYIALSMISDGNPEFTKISVEWEDYYMDIRLLEEICLNHRLDVIKYIVKYLTSYGLVNDFIQKIYSHLPDLNGFEYIQGLRVPVGSFISLPYQDLWAWHELIEMMEADQAETQWIENKFQRINDEKQQILIRKVF